MEKKVESKPAETKHHEEHKEEAEWHQKGSNSTSSWHRVMKVTKETSSKTEECTRTYKAKCLIITHKVAFYPFYSIANFTNMETRLKMD